MPYIFPCYATGTEIVDPLRFSTDKFPFVTGTVVDVVPERFNTDNAVGACTPVAPVNPVEPDAPWIPVAPKPVEPDAPWIPVEPDAP
jgi:hypothetical protein